MICASISCFVVQNFLSCFRIQKKMRCNVDKQGKGWQCKWNDVCVQKWFLSLLSNLRICSALEFYYITIWQMLNVFILYIQIPSMNVKIVFKKECISIYMLCNMNVNIHMLNLQIFLFWKEKFKHIYKIDRMLY